MDLKQVNTRKSERGSICAENRETDRLPGFCVEDGEDYRHMVKVSLQQG